MRSTALAAFAFAACSPGVGRAPIFPDAAPREDARAPDASPPRDAGARDAASPFDAGFGLTDAGPPPSFPFTGIFGILNAQDAIFAREIEGRISLVVGGFPYVYVGAISEAGEVDATGHALERSGCTVARIRGSYDRSSATFRLSHETCGQNGAPIASEIRGGFAQDFDGTRSGVYEMEATVMRDLGGCVPEPGMPRTVRYGVSFLADGSVAVFTAVDMVSLPAVHLGAARPDGSFDALHRTAAAGNGPSFAMSASFPVGPEPRVVGERDVFDAEHDCAFTVSLSGLRVDAP